MKYRYQYIILLLLVVAMSACQFRDDEYVDFANIEAAKGLKFRVIGQLARQALPARLSCRNC